MNTATQNTTEDIRILKTAVCPSLSGKSKLTYQIRQTPKLDIEFRIQKNSASGFFSDEWVSLKRVLEAFTKCPVGEITFYTLDPLIRGKSSNTPGFLLAALKEEGLVVPSTVKRRCYESVDPAKFFNKVKALIDAPVKKAKKVPVKKVKSADIKGQV